MASLRARRSISFSLSRSEKHSRADTPKTILRHPRHPYILSLSLQSRLTCAQCLIWVAYAIFQWFWVEFSEGRVLRCASIAIRVAVFVGPNR